MWGDKILFIKWTAALGSDFPFRKIKVWRRIALFRYLTQCSVHTRTLCLHCIIYIHIFHSIWLFKLRSEEMNSLFAYIIPQRIATDDHEFICKNICFTPQKKVRDNKVFVWLTKFKLSNSERKYWESSQCFVTAKIEGAFECWFHVIRWILLFCSNWSVFESSFNHNSRAYCYDTRIQIESQMGHCIPSRSKRSHNEYRAAAYGLANMVCQIK